MLNPTLETTKKQGVLKVKNYFLTFCPCNTRIEWKPKYRHKWITLIESVFMRELYPMYLKEGYLKYSKLEERLNVKTV